MGRLVIPLPSDKYTQYMEMESDRYYTFPLPFPDDIYIICTSGIVPFLVIEKHKTGCRLRFEGPPRVFMFGRKG